MIAPGVWKKACSITPCSCLILPGQLQLVKRFSASGDRRFGGRLCCADISARIWEAMTSISLTRSRRGGTRIVVSRTSSYRALENKPLSDRRFKLESQAAITRTFNFLRTPVSRFTKPFFKASASLSPISTGSFSTSSRNSVPPRASSSLPAIGWRSPSTLPKNSSSRASNGALEHFTTISGAAARGLA